MGGRVQTTWPQVLAWRMRRHLFEEADPIPRSALDAEIARIVELL